MSYVMFTKTNPDGIQRRRETFPHDICEAVDATGVWRGPCPCCGKPIVLREAGRSASVGDEHFLLHNISDKESGP